MRPAENPYRVTRIHALRYRFVDGSREELWRRLEGQSLRGALVGPEGSGKSTLLRELGEELRTRGFAVRALQLRVEEPVPWDLLRGVGERDAVLLDGSEQLGFGARLRLRWMTRRAGALLITAHAETWLPAVLRTRTTPALLEALASELEDGVEVGDLWSRHSGNVREALRTLYDLRITCSDRPTPHR